MSYAPSLRVGFIEGGFTLNQVPDKKIIQQMNEFQTHSWEYNVHTNQIVGIPHEEHFKAEESLQHLINTILKPNRYVLNGKATTEEKESGRNLKWNYLVENNVVSFVSEVQLQDEMYAQQLASSLYDNKTVLSSILEKAGFKQVAQHVKNHL